MLIALEGIDASGKQTQSREIAAHFVLSGQFEEVSRFDFPHYQTVAGGVVGRMLRGNTIIVPSDIFERPWTIDTLKSSWSLDKAILIQTAMVTDRLEHLEMLTHFAMSTERLLILDRYKLSGIAYGFSDGIAIEWLKLIQIALPDPDLTIYLDIAVEESKRRRPDRRDYYETNFNKLELVRQTYLNEIDSCNRDSRELCQNEEYVVLDGQLDQKALTIGACEAILGVQKRLQMESESLL